jgi:deazaflavin-dependent oxidoreductase (nitroreductase family)
MTLKQHSETEREPIESIGREAFRRFNHLMLFMWRLGMGPSINIWPDGFGQIMVLVHTGRKSGKKHRTPVNYVLIDGDIYCTAGFGAVADWYKNIRQNPQVEVWLPDSWWGGVAEEDIDPQRRLPIMRKVLRASGFAARSMGVDSNTISDEELDQVTRDYRLIRIRRTVARTGPGGPGDLSWVWQVATYGLLFMLMLRKKNRK